MPAPTELVLSCEHAVATVPTAYGEHFAASEARLASHEGYDIGAIEIARHLGRAFDVPVFASSVSRLVADANRSPGHRRVHGVELRDLPAAERRAILDAYHTPHREAVQHRVEQAVSAGARVLHLAVHTFTPVFGGAARGADIGVLYDPQRRWERAIGLDWQRDLRERLPGLRVRRNYPYRGTSDCLPRTLRGLFDDAAYAGIEVEISQALTAGDARARRFWLDALVVTLASLLGR